MNRSAAPRSTIAAAMGTLALAVIVAACSGAASSAASASASPAAQPTAEPAASATTVAPPALPPGGRPGGAGGVATGPAATYADVAYASTSASQVLDIWLPEGATGPVPLVIFIHGGAFQGGDKSMEAGNVASVLAAGYAAASVNYRLSGEALFPAGVQDVKAAVRFLRANAAEYGFDPDRLATWGESAGGHLATMVGVTGDQATIFDDPALGNADVSSAVQAVVDWYGPSDFLQMDAQFAAAPPAACGGQVQAHDPASSPESAWLGAAIQTVPETATAANPITYIATATTLPVFSIAHGDADCLVPNQQSQILHEALTAAGGTSTFTLVEGAGHGDQAITTAQTPVALAMLASVFGR